jgi:hypothetical protein
MFRSRPLLSVCSFALALGLAASAAGAEPRVWTSADGKTVTAALIDATDTTVTIKTDAGREFTLPHERLSQADREIIAAYLAKKKAELDAIVWPRASTEETIKAPLFKKLHGIDAKKHAATYAGKVLVLEGQVIDVREDRMSATQDKVPVEFRFLKSSYEKDLTLLIGESYNRYRGPYGEDAFRVAIADKSLVVERRYVTDRESDYNYAMNRYNYRNKWSDWEVVAKPATRGDIIRIRGEFVSVFNSVISFKDAVMLNPPPVRATRTVTTY